jgi:hypothetical protein
MFVLLLRLLEMLENVFPGVHDGGHPQVQLYNEKRLQNLVKLNSRMSAQFFVDKWRSRQELEDEAEEEEEAEDAHAEEKPAFASVAKLQVAWNQRDFSDVALRRVSLLVVVLAMLAWGTGTRNTRRCVRRVCR